MTRTDTPDREPQPRRSDEDDAGELPERAAGEARRWADVEPEPPEESTGIDAG